MPEHWRIGVVERAVLETLDEMDARPDRPHRKCANVVGRMADEHGISPRYGYDSLCKLSQPWLLHIELVDFHGNYGSLDDAPAAPRYTEARLSPAGALALAAERGTGPRLPLALINGDLHLDGSAPPFSPVRIIASLAALIDAADRTGAELVEWVGLPESPTGCGMTCDVGALAVGESTTLVMSARLRVEAGERGAQIVISNLPLGIGVDQVADALAQRVNLSAHPDARSGSDEFAELRLPLRSLRDESRADQTRVVCEPRADADLNAVERQIASTWGVTVRREVQLPAPLPELIRELVEPAADAQRRALIALAEEVRSG